MSAEATTSRSVAELLSPAALDAIGALEPRARVLADAFVHGGHRSRRLGGMAEFVDYKPYTAGDDLRRLDWRAYARHDRHYVRRSQQESQLTIEVVVDGSASMAYAGGARGSVSRAKFDVARTLAAAIAHIAIDYGDAVGLHISSTSDGVRIPASSKPSQVAQIIDTLVSAAAHGDHSILAGLQSVVDAGRRKQLVCVITDGLDVDIDLTLELLSAIRSRGGDAVLLQLLHTDERTFPFEGVLAFEDMEGARRLQADAAALRRSYLDKLEAFLTSWREGCRAIDVGYAEATTETAPLVMLSALLQQIAPQDSAVTV